MAAEKKVLLIMKLWRSLRKRWRLATSTTHRNFHHEASQFFKEYGHHTPCNFKAIGLNLLSLI
jgi:hypothetical protein